VVRPREGRVRGRRLALLGVVALVGAIAALVAWMRITRVTPESDPVAYWGREGRRVYARMAVVPAADGARVREIFATAPADDPEGLLRDQPGALDALRETVASFLAARYGARMPDDYLDWMLGRGYRFKTAEEFAKAYGPWDDLPVPAGTPPGDPRRLFNAMWHHPWSQTATIQSLCTGPDAAFVTIGHAQQHVFMSQVPYGSLGYGLWHGGSAATCRFWMSPPVTRDELVENHGRVTVAVVGVIVDVPGSDRRPVMVNLVLDPETSRWWVDGVSVLNFLGSGMCMEY
jgi:hypothetical protein